TGTEPCTEQAQPSDDENASGREDSWSARRWERRYYYDDVLTNRDSYVADEGWTSTDVNPDFVHPWQDQEASRSDRRACSTVDLHLSPRSYAFDNHCANLR